MRSQPDRLLRAILIWSAIPMVFLWLPLVRGLMDGSSYEWGLGPLGGSGLSGDYWVLVLIVLFGGSLLSLGWRGGQAPFHWLLLLWHVPLGLAGLAGVLVFRDQMPPLRGDTLGFEMSLAWVGLVPALFAALAVWWVVRDRRAGRMAEKPTWLPANRLLGGLAIALLPLQFWLLRTGEQHGPTDQIGVLLTMLQWILLNLALVPWRSRANWQKGTLLERS